VILGGAYFVYTLIRRDKTVQVYKRQGSTEAPPEPRESSVTASEEGVRGDTTDTERRSSWWAFFGLE
jgi:hypothetical protein